jgi:transposase-like protein
LTEKVQHNAGWYVGAAVFWLLAAWLITVGLSSIIPQIFTPGSGRAGGSCVNTLRDLKDSLLERTSESMARAHSGAERAELTDWLLQWDERMRGARPTCNKSELTAWDELSRLRHGMSGLVDRFDREQSARVKNLDALLN